MSELTHLQCDEFRRLPCSFDNMLRAVHKAGRASMKAEATDVLSEFINECCDDDVEAGLRVARSAILALED